MKPKAKVTRLESLHEPKARWGRASSSRAPQPAGELVISSPDTPFLSGIKRYSLQSTFTSHAILGNGASQPIHLMRSLPVGRPGLQLQGSHLSPLATFRPRISPRCSWSRRFTSRIRLLWSSIALIFSASARRRLRISSSLLHLSSSSSDTLDKSSAGAAPQLSAATLAMVAARQPGDSPPPRGTALPGPPRRCAEGRASPEPAGRSGARAGVPQGQRSRRLRRTREITARSGSWKRGGRGAGKGVEEAGPQAGEQTSPRRKKK